MRWRASSLVTGVLHRLGGSNSAASIIVLSNPTASLSRQCRSNHTGKGPSLNPQTHSFTRDVPPDPSLSHLRPVATLMSIRPKHHNQLEKETFRNHGASLPDLGGMRFVGRVLDLDKKRVLIETGLPGSPHQLRRKDLSLSQVHKCKADARQVHLSGPPVIHSMVNARTKCVWFIILTYVCILPCFFLVQGAK